MEPPISRESPPEKQNEMNATVLHTKPTKEDQLKQLKLSLPHENWMGAYPMYLYQGFWTPVLEPTIAFQNHFQAQNTDVILASMPKTGTTWLKSLLYAITNRAQTPTSESPLLHHNSHELVPHFEFTSYARRKLPDFSNMKSTVPRLFATHIPYPSLPCSIKDKDSKCKIIYVCRNPLDTFISSWHFYLKLDKNETVKPDMIEEYFNKFCEGKFPFGPFDDHVMGYWKESLERPDKVLFLKFEDLKKDTGLHLRKMGEFLGCPFSEEEEKQGLVDDIVRLCSLENMKELEVNQKGKFYLFFENKYLFRKGEVGDWANYLTPDVVARMNDMMNEKFKGSGLKFEHVKSD